MWDFFRVGPSEVVVALVVIAAIALSRVGRRWLPRIVPCLFVAVVMSPADPLSMLLVALPLTAGVIAWPGVLQRRHAS